MLQPSLYRPRGARGPCSGPRFSRVLSPLPIRALVPPGPPGAHLGPVFAPAPTATDGAEPSQTQPRAIPGWCQPRVTQTHGRPAGASTPRQPRAIQAGGAGSPAPAHTHRCGTSNPATERSEGAPPHGPAGNQAINRMPCDRAADSCARSTNPGHRQCPLPTSRASGAPAQAPWPEKTIRKPLNQAKRGGNRAMKNAPTRS